MCWCGKLISVPLCRMPIRRTGCWMPMWMRIRGNCMNFMSERISLPGLWWMRTALSQPGRSIWDWESRRNMRIPTHCRKTLLILRNTVLPGWRKIIPLWPSGSMKGLMNCIWRFPGEEKGIKDIWQYCHNIFLLSRGISVRCNFDGKKMKFIYKKDVNMMRLPRMLYITAMRGLFTWR